MKTKWPAGVLSFDEKHSARVALDSYRDAYDRARAAGLSAREASEIAQDAMRDTEAAYRGER